MGRVTVASRAYLIRALSFGRAHELLRTIRRSVRGRARCDLPRRRIEGHASSRLIVPAGRIGVRNRRCLDCRLRTGPRSWSPVHVLGRRRCRRNLDPGASRCGPSHSRPRLRCAGSAIGPWLAGRAPPPKRPRWPTAPLRISCWEFSWSQPPRFRIAQQQGLSPRAARISRCLSRARLSATRRPAPPSGMHWPRRRSGFSLTVLAHRAHTRVGRKAQSSHPPPRRPGWALQRFTRERQ